ncbi:MAG: carboxypeptidase-like regulatory domain-containing protein [Bradymonadia bacterium]
MFTVRGLNGTMLGMVLLSLFTLTGCGGGQQVIMGRVVNPQGAPVTRAEVSTEPPTDIVLTNTKGIFSIRQIIMDDGGVEPLETGRYVVTVRQLGFDDLEVEVDYDGGTVKLPELELIPKGMDISPTAPDPTQEFRVDPDNPAPPVQGT